MILPMASGDPEPGPSSKGKPADHAALERGLPELLMEIRQGSQSAFAEFYDRTSALVFCTALRVLRDRHSAEEVTHDVFMNVWRNAASFDAGRSAVTTWLLVIARSRAVDRRRSHAARARREEGMPDHAQAAAQDLDPDADPRSQHGRKERRLAVRDAMQQLPSELRAGVELAYDQGLSHSEIAQRLQLPLGTVKTRIRRGMAKLRELLRPWEVCDD